MLFGFIMFFLIRATKKGQVSFEPLEFFLEYDFPLFELSYLFRVN